MKSKLLFFFTFIFWTNTFAQIDFEEHIVIDNTFGLNFAESVFTTDLDGDGDIDVLSASRNDNKIAWYENIDGLGSFNSRQIITTTAISANSVHADDLDGDGDMDVLSTSFGDDKIAWYENTDGLGNFGEQQIITTNAEVAETVYTADMDGDGDIDVLSASASFSDSKVAWYENTDGLGTFGEQQIITTNAAGAESVFAIDIDGDNDIDVLSSSAIDHKIAWYENLSPLALHENKLLPFSIYPIPTNGILSIQSNTKIAKIEIYNNTGQILLSNLKQNKVDLSSLSSGIYFCKVIDESGNSGMKKVLKE